MRHSQDIEVCETKDEFLRRLSVPKTVTKKQKKTTRYKTEFFDVTATFDIETTNTDEDGFAYSYQMCIGGVVVVPRYVEDWLDIIDTICDKWRVSENRRLVIYIHNLGYEFMYLSQILAGKWGIKKALYTKSRKPLFITFDNGVELRDSLKLFQKSLARATEGCKHEKLKGDLDYSVYRTPDTPLDDTEFSYCVNDVLGLWEAIEKLKAERGYNQATIPYTNTGIVIEAVNREIRHDYRCIKKMEALHLNKEQTLLLYKCMAGGDTHGTRWRAGQTYYNCNSYDFKSAHPSQQLLWDFPTGKPIDYPENAPRAEMENLIKCGFGWCAEIFIRNPQIKPECPDPCISVSKCADIQGINGVDNGRLLGAEGILLYCDSNDWQRISDGYTFDEMTAVKSVAFRLAPLPDSFRKAIFEKFKIKETMKGSPDYMFSKICVNTIFGACAQKTVRDEYTMEICEEGITGERKSWEENLDGMTDEKVLKTQTNKFPFLWGLWTASLTRLKLWRLLKIVGWDNVIYWDTDSCKFEGHKVAAVEEYNAEIKAQCEKRGCVVTKSNGKNVYIGVAEDEHPQAEYGYKEFRFLHAKCYAVKTCDDEIESTIAGVGKKEGIEALKGSIENLNEWLVIPDAGGQMLTYHDAPVKKRHDFARPTLSASWVVMTPRRYEVGGFEQTLLNQETDYERLG